MKTWGSLAKVVKLVGVTVVVPSLLLFGASRSPGKRNHRSEVKPSLVATGAAAGLSTTKDDAKWRAAYGKLPLSFEENMGQTAREVRFVSHGAGYGLFLTAEEAVLSLNQSMPRNLSPLHRTAFFRALHDGRQARRMTAIRMRLEGANPAAQIVGVDPLAGKVNYFIGSDPKDWRGDVPAYARVKYTGVYPGVDLVYYGNQQHLEYDFVVGPGADPKVIELSLKGAQKLRINSNGDLILSVGEGQVALQKPVIYQNVAGERREIAGAYALAGNNRVKIALAKYDRSEPLFIDPVLNYSTYLGGSALGDTGQGIAVDSAGDAFVAGETFSIAFPTTSNAFNKGPLASNANGAIFVTEINPAGTSEIYSTYLAGSGGDFALGITLDPSGNIYVTGATFSTDFPTTSNGLKHGANAGATTGTSYIAKINPTLSGTNSLVYSSYLGGSGGSNPDFGNAIAADANGSAYVVGITAASAGTGLANFPVTTATAFQSSLPNNAGNAFLTRIDTTQSGNASLIYSTYLGGNGANAVSSGLGFADEALGVAVDSANNAYLTGTTTSTNFPTSTTGFKTTAPLAVANGTAFVSRIDTTKTGNASLVYSSYLGGERFDFATAAGLGPNNVAYVTGTTNSLAFPTLPAGAFQTTGSVTGAAFVSLIDTAQTGSTSLKYSTFLGGGGTTGFGIRADAAGNAYVVGGTNSSAFPVTPGAFQPTFAAGAKGEGFLSKLSPAGSGAADLVYSSFFGGSGSASGPDGIHAVAVDSSNNAYITGVTFSSNLPVFPAAAFQKTLPVGSTSAAFIAKLTLIPTLTFSPATLNFGTQLVNTTSAPQIVTVTNNSNAALAITSIAVVAGSPAASGSDYVKASDTCGVSIPAGASCMVGVTFKPSAPPSVESATLIFTDISPQSVSLTGTGSTDFTVTAPATSTVAQGATTTFTVTVAPVGGFNSAVALACTGAPALATCIATPTSVTPADGITPVTSSVMITTTANGLIMPLPPVPAPPLSLWQIVPLVMALIMVFLLPRTQRLRLRLGMVAAMLIFIALAGCSGSGKPGTPKGTTNLTITGTSGALSHSTTVALTVK